MDRKGQLDQRLKLRGVQTWTGIWKSINEKFTKPCDRCSPLGDAQIRELRLGKANLVKMKEEFGFAESGWNFNIIKCC